MKLNNLAASFCAMVFAISGASAKDHDGTQSDQEKIAVVMEMVEAWNTLD